MLCNHRRFFTSIGACSLIFVVFTTAAIAQDPLEGAPLAPESMPTARASEPAPTVAANKADAKSKTNAAPEFIVRSPAEWRKILTKMQFAVTRQKMTEQPFGGRYASGHYRGTFVCVCCDAVHVQSELFSSKTKFDSGTGWPSFYQAINSKALQTAMDYSEGEPRIEVMCRRCGAHLGHVFDDGPLPTGMRFCINSASIKLVAPDGEGTAKSASGHTTSKAKAKTKASPSSHSASKGVSADKSTDRPDANAEPASSKNRNVSPGRASDD